MKPWHCWHWGSGHTWASAFLSGWMLLARWVALMCTLGKSTRIPTRLNMTFLLLAASIWCAHLRSTKKFYCYWLLRFITNIWSWQGKTFCCRSDPLLIFTQTFPAGRWSAGWYLTYTFLNYPQVGRLPICWHLRFSSPYQDINIQCEHLGSTRKLLLLSFWFLYSTAHEPFFLVASRLVDNWSALYITHSNRWLRRSADIYKFLNLTWTSTFLAPCWRLIPLPWSAKPFNFQIETISRSSIHLLQIDIIGTSAFNARPGTNHPYLPPCWHSLILQAYLHITFLLLASSWLLCFGLPIHSKLHREKESGPTIIYWNGHHCQIGSPGNKSPLLAFLLSFTDSFASPGQETSLLLVLPTAHSFALALPIQLPQIKIVWAIDLSAEIDVIGISAHNARPGMSYPYLLSCCYLKTP